MPVPAIAAAAGGAAVGLLGGGVAAATGAGKSKYYARNFQDTKEYDPNKFAYGGSAGAADEMAQRDRNQAGAYQEQQGKYLGQADLDRHRELEARAGMGRAAGMMEQRAQGNNLISSRIAQNNRNAILGEASSAAASARGPAALALAQQNGVNAASAGMADVAANEMTAGAQEKLAAEQAALGANSAMRQGDSASRALGLNAGNQAGQMSAQYGQLENNVRQNQLVGGMANQQTLSQSLNNQQAIDSGTQQNNANRDMDYLKMAMGGVSGGLESGAKMATPAPAPPAGGRAKGGPVDRAKPYLVGEEGPELIIPRRDGFVLTAPQTRQALTSDPMAKEKINILGFSEGMDPTAQIPTSPTFEVLGPTGGEDVAASGKAMSDYATRFGKSPGAVPMASDPKTKKEVSALSEADEMIRNLERRLGDGPSVRRVASGSKENGYETELTRGGEQAFRGRFGRDPDTSDYDLRGAFADGETDGKRFNVDGRGVSFPDHLTDRFKKPGHETFSDESRYAQDAPERAGRWQGNQYMPPASDPAAKEEARLIGVQQGIAQARRGDAESQHKDSGSWLGSTYLSPLGAIPGVIQGFRAADNDAEADAALKRADEIANKGKKRQPNTVERLPAKALDRTSGPDRVGVPRKDPKFSEEDMTVNPNLYAPKLPYPGESIEERMGLAPGYFDQRQTPSLYPAAPPHPTSDPRAKVLGGVHDNEISKVLDSAPAVSYKYKDPYFEPDAEKPGQTQVGFLTSDLKKTPAGASVVEKRPDGYEGYNQHRMTGLQWAGLENVHERLRELEARLAGGKGR